MSIDVAGWLGGVKTLSGGNVSDALGEGGWDWDVDLFPASTRITRPGVDVKRRIEDTFAVVRMSDYKPLAAVGNFFRPIQHREAFGVIDLLVAQGRLTIEAGQSLKDGRKVVLVTRMDEPLTIAGEPFDPLQVWMNGHDGRTPVVMFPTPTRVSCTNQLAGLKALAGKDAGSYKLKHTKMAPAKLLAAQQEIFGVNQIDAELEELDASVEREAARTERDLGKDASIAMRRANNYNENLKRVGDDLARVKFSDRDFDNFLKKLVKIEDGDPPRQVTLREDKRAELRLIWRQGEDMNNLDKTAWRALNTVSYYTDHVRSHRGGHDSQLLSMLEGKNDNQRALALLS